jgi:peroxiredoxin
MPNTALPATDRASFDLSAASDYVLYIYARTGGPDITLPADWDSIPGARGCTPQSWSFGDSLRDFHNRGFDLVGLSAQGPTE